MVLGVPVGNWDIQRIVEQNARRHVTGIINSSFGATTNQEEVSKLQQIKEYLVSRLDYVGEEENVSVCWGQAASFQIVEFENSATSVRVTVDFVDSTEEPSQGEGGGEEEPTPADIQLLEVERNVDVIRVENPDDANQWVDVERITSNVFEVQNDCITLRVDIGGQRYEIGPVFLQGDRLTFTLDHTLSAAGG